MKYCENCKKEFHSNSNFCPICGSKLKEINENQNNKRKKSSKKIIITIVSIIIVAIIAGVSIYFIKSKPKEVEVKKSIEVKKVDLKDYPTVSIIIQAKNIDDEITTNNITIEEEDYFVKNIKVKKAEDNDRYLVSYESNDNNSNKDLNAILEYANENEDIKCKFSYKSPEIEKENNTSDNVSLNTYDPNIEVIKDKYEGFIDRFISMINYGNISYMDDYVVIGSNLYNDFVVSIESFNKQNISEQLEEYNIQDVKKIDDDTYEVYVYEAYNIYYGKEHSRKLKTFNSIYTVHKSNESFKFTDLRYAE